MVPFRKCASCMVLICGLRTPMGGLTQSQRCIAYRWDNRYLAHHRADITDTLASERMKVLTTSSPSFKGSLAALLLLPEFGAPPSDWNPRTPVSLQISESVFRSSGIQILPLAVKLDMTSSEIDLIQSCTSIASYINQNTSYATLKANSSIT